MSRVRKRDWKPQDTISVRIPKDVDPAILDWLCDLSDSEILQATVIEAIHRMYYDERGVDTIAVPRQQSYIDRRLLPSMVAALGGVGNAVPVVSQEKMPIVQASEPITEPTNEHDVKMGEVIDNALDFYK